MDSEDLNYEIFVDEPKNVLFIEFKNFLSDTVLSEAMDKLIHETKKLKPGFTVVADHAKFKPTTPKGTEEIKRGQKFLNQQGVKRIIRVMNPEQITGKIQFDRLSRESYTQNVEIINVGSVAEAFELLKKTA